MTYGFLALERKPAPWNRGRKPPARAVSEASRSARRRGSAFNGVGRPCGPGCVRRLVVAIEICKNRTGGAFGPDGDRGRACRHVSACWEPRGAGVTRLARRRAASVLESLAHEAHDL